MKTRSLRRKRLFGNLLTYCIVAAAFVILQLLNAGGMLSPSLQGQLVPICAYVTMAVALNLVVGFACIFVAVVCSETKFSFLTAGRQKERR